MAVKTVISCDVCSKFKDKENHWFSIRIHDNQAVVKPEFVCSLGVDGKTPFTSHVCGSEHAITLFNRFLQYGNIYETQVTGDPDSNG